MGLSSWIQGMVPGGILKAKSRKMARNASTIAKVNAAHQELKLQGMSLLAAQSFPSKSTSALFIDDALLV